mmetsp:Transcript_70457/g.166067  ORF Transcript_70457/g.166067 Transcript_70457/m.166067 type:complete len:326 (+) Transcript_70457:628-1605(+)
MRGHASHVGPVVPAALAFGMGAGRDDHAELRRRHQLHRRGDEDEAQVLAQAGEQGLVLLVDLQHQLCLQRRADGAGGAHGLNGLVDLVADLVDAGPLGQQAGFGRAEVPVGLGEDGLALREDLPGFLGREAEEGRHPAQHRVRDLPQRGLGRAAGQALGRRGVEAVLQHVEVEGAEVLGAIDLQLGHHRVELVALEVGQDLGLQLGRAGQRIAVHLQQLGGGDGVRRRVEVAGVGEQEAQRVADAAVAVDDAGEDLVVQAQVTGVVGRGRPQAQDLGAVFVAHRLRRDHIALRLAHLAALAVDDEAMGQQALVGRAAVEGAGDQQ